MQKIKADILALLFVAFLGLAPNIARAELVRVQIEGVGSAKFNALVMSDIKTKEDIVGSFQLKSITKDGISFDWEKNAPADFLISELNRFSLFSYQLLYEDKTMLRLGIDKAAFDQFKLTHLPTKDIEPYLHEQFADLDMQLQGESEANDSFYLANKLIDLGAVIAKLDGRLDHDFYVIKIVDSVTVEINQIGKSSFSPLLEVYDVDFNQLQGYDLTKEKQVIFKPPQRNQVIYLHISDQLGDMRREVGRLAQPYSYMIKLY